MKVPTNELVVDHKQMKCCTFVQYMCRILITVEYFKYLFKLDLAIKFTLRFLFLSLHCNCNDRHAFFTSDALKIFSLQSNQKVCAAVTFLLDNIYIIFVSKLYRQIVVIPTATKCAPLVANLFCTGWLCGAMVLENLPAPGRPTNLDNSRAKAYCACSRCGWGFFGHFSL